MEEHATQTVTRILSADEVRERQRYFLRRREPVLAVENHAVAAIQHQHGGAGALIFALVHVQVRIIHVQRDFGAFPPDRGEQRFADIQIQDVAEFVDLGCAGGFDAGGQIARIVPAEAGFTE